MANISLQTFTTLVQNMGAVTQSRCAQLTQWASGGVARALMEGCASVAMWLQYLILQVLSMTRLATSTGADVDSFVGDYGLTREEAAYATTDLTFSSLNPATTSAVIQVGALAKTADGVLQYAVIQNVANAWWSSADGAYVRPAGTTSIIVPVQCLTAGTTGNVAAGTINLLGSQIPGIDTVTNANELTDGTNAESDAALKARFIAYIASLQRGTETAVESALSSVSTGLMYKLKDCQDPSGNTIYGYFTVLLNTGGLTVSSEIITEAAAAVEATRAFGVSYAVVAAPVAPVSVAIVVVFSQTATSAVRDAVFTTIGTAVAADINSTAIESGYDISRLSFLAISNGSGLVTGITVGTLNGASTSIPAGSTVRTSGVTVTAAS